MIPLIELSKIEQDLANMERLNTHIGELIAQAQSNDADAWLSLMRAKKDCREFWALIHQCLNRLNPAPKRYKPKKTRKK